MKQSPDIMKQNTVDEDKLLRATQSCNSCLTKERRSILRYFTQSDSLSESTREGRNSSDDDDDSDGHHPQVRFHLIRIYEHPVLLGDNPGGIFGPPLTLDWEAQARYEMPLDDYEENRPERRNKRQLALHESDRLDILRRCGYSRDEITRLTKPVNQARARRKATTQSLKLAGIQEYGEKASRKIANILSLGKKKREQRRFLEACSRFDRDKVTNESFKDSIRTDTTEDLENADEGFVIYP